MTQPPDGHIIVPEDPVEKLLALTHRQFYNFVDQDARGRLDDGVGEKLRDPSIVERWYLVLVQMKKNVEGQLGSAKADFKSKQYDLLRRLESTDGENAGALREALFELAARHEASRAKKMRFRSAVDDALQEARFYRERLRESSGYLRAMILQGAIEKHRDSIDPEDVTDFDRELWETIIKV